MATTRRQVPALFRAASAVIALTWLIAAAPSTLAADHTVDISGFSYSPREVTVTVGDRVTWTNADAQSHTATADDSSWNSGTIGTNASRSVTVATAGTFPYHCAIHPDMKATLTVTGGTASAPPTDTAGVDARDGEPRGREALVLAGAALVGALLARRRFARA